MARRREFKGGRSDIWTPEVVLVRIARFLHSGDKKKQKQKQYINDLKQIKFICVHA